jgi:hypothetical protein
MIRPHLLWKMCLFPGTLEVASNVYTLFELDPRRDMRKWQLTLIRSQPEYHSWKWVLRVHSTGRFTSQGKNLQQSLDREESRSYLDSDSSQFTQTHSYMAKTLNNESKSHVCMIGTRQLSVPLNTYIYANVWVILQWRGNTGNGIITRHRGSSITFLIIYILSLVSVSSSAYLSSINSY